MNSKHTWFATTYWSETAIKKQFTGRSEQIICCPSQCFPSKGRMTPRNLGFDLFFPGYLKMSSSTVIL